MSPDWRPAAALAQLRLRAALLGRIRAFFAERGVLEVETPILSAAATPDRHIESFTTAYRGPGVAGELPLYLHTSPEFPMKRLLVAGSGPIYQIARVFRQGESGRRHNPEFTLLEWYRTGWDHHRLMGEVAELVTALLEGHVALAAPEYLSYREAFLRHAGIDPLAATVEALRACAATHGIEAVGGLAVDDPDPWRDLLLTHLIEPHLGRGRLTFLHDYPASQAALARVRPEENGAPAVAERFELYLEGAELANGFHELADAGEQRRRFTEENARRRAMGTEKVPLDEPFLAALAHGLPDCAGVALGVDRVVMAAAGADALEEVIAFPLDRA